MVAFDSILQDEQIFWRQISRIAWLKEGDRNKKFFYIRASARKRENVIKDLVDKKGVWTEDDEWVEITASSYFTEIFFLAAPSIKQMDAALKNVSNKITDET